MAARLRTELGPFRLHLTRELCPLPPGEPRLTEILADNVRGAARADGSPLGRVVLVDHGSPIPEVSAVRQWLAQDLRSRLGEGVQLREAVMERRPGPAYDFNGRLLADVLEDLAQADPVTPIILSLLFLAPGRHAGPQGDIARICTLAEQAHRGLRVLPTPLVGEHPTLLAILADRAREAWAGRG
jgi:sirohydrochlorin ferrochelatase